jgi:hypothetical protein
VQKSILGGMPKCLIGCLAVESNIGCNSSKFAEYFSNCFVKLAIINRDRGSSNILHHKRLEGVLHHILGLFNSIMIKFIELMIETIA